MHPGVFLLGYFLGLLAKTNDVLALDHQVPFIYNEVKNPTSEDLDSFQEAIKLVLNETTRPFKPTNILSFYRKIDVIRLSYKAYFSTSEGNVCFVKWRVWATNFTTISVHSCDWEDSQEVTKDKAESSIVEVKSTVKKAGRAISRKEPRQKLPIIKIGRGLIFPRVQATGMLNSKKKGVTVFMIANSTVTIQQNGKIRWAENYQIKPHDDDESEVKTEKGTRKKGMKTANRNFLKDDWANLNSENQDSETDLLHLLKSNSGDGYSRNPGKDFDSDGSTEHILQSKRRRLLGGNRGVSGVDTDRDSSKSPEMGYTDVHDSRGYGGALGAPAMRASIDTSRYLINYPQGGPVQSDKYGTLESTDEDEGREDNNYNLGAAPGEGMFGNTAIRLAYGSKARGHPGWVPKAGRKVQPTFVPYVKKDADRFRYHRITKRPFRKYDK